MPTSNQKPLTAPRGGNPHDFRQKQSDWEAAVFDGAAYFSVVRFRSPLGRVTDDFGRAADAIAFARSSLSQGPCVYAISDQGRSVLLDPEKWDEWLQRATEAVQ